MTAHSTRSWGEAYSATQTTAVVPIPTLCHCATDPSSSVHYHMYSSSIIPDMLQQYYITTLLPTSSPSFFFFFSRQNAPQVLFREEGVSWHVCVCKILDPTLSYLILMLSYPHTPLHSSPYCHITIHSYSHTAILPYTHTPILLYTHTPIHSNRMPSLQESSTTSTTHSHGFMTSVFP